MSKHHDLLEIALEIRNSKREFRAEDSGQLDEWADRIERALGFATGYGNTFVNVQSFYNEAPAE